METKGKEGNVGKLIEQLLNSLVGLTTPKTMKVMGSIMGQPVVVLIDCGATHNFISAELVEQLGLSTTETTSYGVFMGTGLSVRGADTCKGVVVSLPSIEVTEDFLPLQLAVPTLYWG